jgi:protein ImuB
VRKAASRSRSDPGRRHLALWLPLLSADRRTAQRRSASPGEELPPEPPLAFVEKQRGAMRVVALDAAALALGLAPGLTLADARARVPELAAVDHDPLADRLWLERLADGCDRWTPMVALDPHDGITLDITGCLEAYGLGIAGAKPRPFSDSLTTEAALAADIERRFALAGIHLRQAIGGSPEAAQALARYQTMPAADEAGAIRRLPVAALRLDDEIAVALRRAGLKTIGDIASRPTAPLAARFGEDMVAALDRLLGRADSRIVPRRALPALLFERRFAEPIARTEDALVVLDDLMREAALELEERRGGGRRFAARLYRSDGAVRDLSVETGLPTRDPTVPARLFRERIDTLADPIDPGFGFDMIRLCIATVEPLAATQLKLEGGQVSEEAMAALVDRLGTRIGRSRVRRFRSVETHIPEQAAFALPAIEMPDPARWAPPTPGEPALRPLHLFDPPQRIEVAMFEVPDGPPRRFRWRRTLHEVTRYEGPERIAGEWWRVRVDRLPDPGRPTLRPSPGRDAMDCDEAERAERHPSSDRPAKPLLTRDYFRVEDVRGRRFWLFRHGLYGDEADHPDWYLHGLFA